MVVGVFLHKTACLSAREWNGPWLRKGIMVHSQDETCLSCGIGKRASLMESTQSSYRPCSRSGPSRPPKPRAICTALMQCSRAHCGCYCCSRLGRMLQVQHASHAQTCSSRQPSRLSPCAQNSAARPERYRDSFDPTDSLTLGAWRARW